jgi:hypothetical protein
MPNHRKEECHAATRKNTELRQLASRYDHSSACHATVVSMNIKIPHMLMKHLSNAFSP